METKPPEPAKPEAPAPAVVPEKYEFKFEGDSKIDDKLIEKVTPIFKELGLSQDAATKLATFYNEQATALVKNQQDAYTTMRDGWRTEAVNDKSLGDGKDLRPEVKQAIGNAINQLGKDGDGFRQALDVTGVGDNPAFVRGLYSLAKLLTEGKSVTGAGPSPNGQRAPGSVPRNAAQALYPNLPSSNA